MTRHRVSDAAIVAQIPQARAAAVAHATSEPRAVAVTYNAKRDRVDVDLANGCSFSVATALLPAVRHGTAAQKAEAQVSPLGGAIHWEALDADYYVTFLMSAVLGDRAWRRELARAAGRATSPAKTRASRANGAKGGRPRKLRPARAARS
jgi:hypothetical protein